MAKKTSSKIAAASKKLFANQGFDVTTLQQIANRVGVTQPLLYYHFKGKADIFTSTIKIIYDEYVDLIQELPQNPDTQFDKITNFFRLHLRLAENKPDDARLILASCPDRLNNDDHTCQEIMQQKHDLITGYLRECLEAGNASGEFDAHPVEQVTIVLSCLLQEVIRKKLSGRKSDFSYGHSAIEFCRRALIPNPDR